MRYKQVGRSGLKVSQLGLGALNFGYVTSEHEAFKIMDEAINLGINLIDTANVYGGPQSPDMEKGYGISEEIIGNWLRQNKRRNEIVLSTKVYQPMGLGVNDRRLSAYHIRRACEDSLKRLQTDHIDIYYMHHIDRLTPWEEIWQAMELLIQQGKVSYIASSNFAGWDIATAQAVAEKRHLLGLIAEQSLYNLTNRAIELEVIPACKYHGIGLMPWYPIGGGLLGGVLNPPLTEGRRSKPDIQEQIIKMRSQLSQYETLCQKIDKSPSNVALAWLLHNESVTAPLIGPRTTGQLLELSKALEIQLTDEILHQLDIIWPGPGGEAPQAYAW